MEEPRGACCMSMYMGNDLHVLADDPAVILVKVLYVVYSYTPNCIPAPTNSAIAGLVRVA